jgi:PD-(D/E)XK nuclease superfamily protein
VFPTSRRPDSNRRPTLYKSVALPAELLRRGRKSTSEHAGTIANVCSVLDHPPTDSSHPVDVGQRSEAVILAELVKRGYTVLTPFGVNHRYDLVVEHNGGFLRVQCKTGRLRDGVILFATRSTRATARGVHARGYAGEAELFLVYCPDTEAVYSIPVADAAATGGSLRVSPPRNGQSKRVRFAREYELPPRA